MKIVLSIIIGYLLGSLNGAYILGKFNGIDIRDVNSHNPGAANAKLTFGWKGFFFVWLFDMAKVNAAYYLVQWLFPDPAFLCVIAAAFSVIGHCYSIFMGFKGGKGFSSYCGLALAYNPLIFAGYLVVTALLALITKSLTFMTFFALISAPIIFAVFKADLAVVIALVCCSIFVGLRHHKNLSNFLHNTDVSIDEKPIGIGLMFKTVEEKQDDEPKN